MVAESRSSMSCENMITPEIELLEYNTEIEDDKGHNQGKKRKLL